MGNIRKHLVSIIVFGINLILMGVGFLFIKNSDEAKKKNLADENITEGTLTESEVTARNNVEIPVSKESASVTRKNVAPDTKNISSSTAPAISTATSGSANANTNNTSTKKSSATTKTS
ncbi:MAG: hypothetical protein WC737_01965 [Parcubacteria group bacterium]